MKLNHQLGVVALCIGASVVSYAEGFKGTIGIVCFDAAERAHFAHRLSTAGQLERFQDCLSQMNPGAGDRPGFSIDPSGSTREMPALEPGDEADPEAVGAAVERMAEGVARELARD